jgi:glutamate 5-kinase
LLKNNFFKLNRSLGTSSIVHETTHQPLLFAFLAVVERMLLSWKRHRRHGRKVVLVSSGAIGVGLKRMNQKWCVFVPFLFTFFIVSPNQR